MYLERKLAPIPYTSLFRRIEGKATAWIMVVRMMLRTKCSEEMTTPNAG